MTDGLKALDEIMPKARVLGPDGCERRADYHARFDLKTALLWHAAACLVAYETEKQPA